MPPSIPDSYLETKVLTASPQKLQSMLIEAAIRNLRRGKQLWNQEKNDDACEAMIRAQEIVTQILSGLNRDVDSELARKVAGIYMFVFRTITQAQRHRDAEQIDHCLQVLEVERETWKMLCEKLEQQQQDVDPATPHAPCTPAVSPPLPHTSSTSHTLPNLEVSDSFGDGPATSSGFSIEA